MSVCENCVKTVYFKVSTRKNGDNLDKFNARLLDLKSIFRFILTCYMSWWRWMVSNSNKFVLIRSVWAISRLLRTARAEGVLGSS